MRRRRQRPPFIPSPAESKSRAAEMLAHVKAGARDLPGVYEMRAADGEIIYVGKSKKLRTRLLSYFRAEYPADKGARILREAAEIQWEYVPSEFASLLEELKRIKRYRPRHNVAGKRDARHFAFIRVARGAAESFRVVRGAGTDEGGVFFGPFHGAIQLNEALRELNDALGLRDCALDTPMHFADQAEMFALPRTPGCIRHEIGKCLGPCVGAVRRDEYAARFALARAFLEGANDVPVAALRGAMDAASERLEFERAAALRDKIERLESLRAQFARLRFAVESLSFVYTPATTVGDEMSYIIRRGRVRAALPSPRTADERRVFDAKVAGIFAPVERTDGTVPSHEIDELLLVTSWFTRFPKELERTSALAPAPATRSA
ncbi:MAG: UvrB/UvrC motif-containing protein [Gemmatimonadaceae bacterium]|nr:UvrB/UvrC motif-containing protein [Gemmatimonadaceae bacterium]